MAKATPKSKAGKKSASKTEAAPASKKNNAVSPSRELAKLAKDLKDLIPKLDREGLSFLVRQAHVHLYNMQVDALNKTMITGEEQKKTTVKKPVKTKEAGFTEVKISDTGSSYYIIYNNEWIAFSREEITTLVKIVMAEGSEMEIKERLYNWLCRERKDLLYSASIPNKFDAKLKSLIALLKDNFKLKK